MSAALALVACGDQGRPPGTGYGTNNITGAAPGTTGASASTTTGAGSTEPVDSAPSSSGAGPEPTDAETTSDGATTSGASSDAGSDASGGSTEEGTGGALGECPASEPVTLSEWSQEAWVAPGEGDAQVSFRLSKETWKHYARLELDVDIDVTDVQTPYNCFLELRNTGGPKDGPFPWRYFAVCTKNQNPKKLVYIVFAADDGYTPEPFALQANTSYHVSVVFDAELGEATLAMTPEGGAPVTVFESPLTSSITPQGHGLDLLVGFTTSHPDYPEIKPPWGWSFRDLHVSMTPGGPFGADAPACD